jgi:hypothetical protein
VHAYTGSDLAEFLTEAGKTFSIRVKSIADRKAMPQFFAKLAMRV